MVHIGIPFSVGLAGGMKWFARKRTRAPILITIAGCRRWGQRSDAFRQHLFQIVHRGCKPLRVPRHVISPGTTWRRPGFQEHLGGEIDAVKKAPKQRGCPYAALAK